MTASNLDMDDLTIMNRYLTDQLTDAERDAFEAELVRQPDRMRELEATARLKVGLRQLRESGELEPLLSSARSFGSPSLLALAAALGVLVVGALLFRADVSSSKAPLLAAAASSLVDRQGRVLQVTTTRALFRKRVEGYDAVLQQARSQQAIEIRVLPQAQAEPKRYRASLSRLREDDSVEPVASVANLRPMADGFVTVFADASRLEPGRYRLIVSGEGAGSEGTGDSFLIRVLPAPSN